VSFISPCGAYTVARGQHLPHQRNKPCTAAVQWWGGAVLCYGAGRQYAPMLLAVCHCRTAGHISR